MRTTIAPECATWKRAPTPHRCVCEGAYHLPLLSPVAELVGEVGDSCAQGCWGTCVIQRYLLTLSLFITGIKIVPNGHNRQGKPNTRKDSIQFPIKFKRKTNNFSDNRNCTGTYMSSIPQIILFSPKLVQTAAISSESWNLHPPKQLYSSKCYVH